MYIVFMGFSVQASERATRNSKQNDSPVPSGANLLVLNSHILNLLWAFAVFPACRPRGSADYPRPVPPFGLHIERSSVKCAEFSRALIVMGFDSHTLFCSTTDSHIHQQVHSGASFFAGTLLCLLGQLETTNV